MSPMRRSIVPVIVPMVLSAVILAGCTGSGSNQSSSSDPTATPSDVIPSAVGTQKGSYVYNNSGLTARMQLTADGGTLTVVNETGRDLERPDFYLLDARDGAQIDGKVEGSSPVPDGATKEFNVSFAKSIETQNIGLVILLMGRDNYGAFVNE